MSYNHCSSGPDFDEDREKGTSGNSRGGGRERKCPVVETGREERQHKDRGMILNPAKHGIL